MTKFELETFEKLLNMYRNELDKADEWTMLGVPVSQMNIDTAKRHADELSAFVGLIDKEGE